jgi:eukaryotic-like serine/threonine-protein kinase
VNLRTLSRRAFPYLIVSIGGFLVAYVVVFFFAFPSELIPEDVKVPNVLGKDFATASQMLEKSGFHAVQGQERYSRTAAQGTILEQEPPAGSRIKKGTDVTLAISMGQKSAEVPQVNGLPEQQAKIVIANTGLQLGKVMREASDMSPGTVIGTNPGQGEMLPLPAKVDLRVSDGPSTVMVPELVGRTLPDAQSALEQVGLGLASAGSDTSSVYPPNTVLSQSPKAGTTVKAHSRIRIVLAKVAPPPPPKADTDSVPPDTTRKRPRPREVATLRSGNTESKAGDRFSPDVLAHGTVSDEQGIPIGQRFFVQMLYGQSVSKRPRRR